MAATTSPESWADFYADRGFAGRTGFGDHPALLVIDMGRAWTDPASPIGTDYGDMIDRIATVLEHARRAKVPIFYTTMQFPPTKADVEGVYCQKYTNLPKIKGEQWSRIADRIAPSDDDTVVWKHRPSALYGTTLLSQLNELRVDTVLITGVSTSGCVRSTAEDSFNAGLRTVVIRDCVGDRSPAAHEANMIDIDNRYADVVDRSVVEEYLNRLRR